MEEKKKRTWLRVLVIVLCSLLLLALLAVLAGYLYITGKLNLMPRIEGTVDTLSSSEMLEYSKENTESMPEDYTGEVLDAEEVTWGTLPETPIEEGKDIVNLLLIGVDKSYGGRSRSDAMILCTYNRKNNSVTLTSLMRDMYVQIPGYMDNRINACYVFGGISLLNECIRLNFGIEVDGNFLVDFDSFKDVIDVVGGVDITLSAAEAEYMNNVGLWESKDQYLAGTFRAGVNRLNGTAALSYARNRTIGMWDFERTQRQRNVLAALFARCKQMSVSELDSLLDKMLPLITTDMSNSEIIDLAVSVIPKASGMKVATHRIPTDDGYRNAWVNGMSVLIPNLEKNRQELEKIIYGEN